MRPTHFSGGVTENAISPRFGMALNVPRLKWTFRASYGHYYQPPLSSRFTASATKKNSSA